MRDIMFTCYIRLCCDKISLYSIKWLLRYDLQKNSIGYNTMSTHEYFYTLLSSVYIMENMAENSGPSFQIAFLQHRVLT